jgi:hypothetical protein
MATATGASALRAGADIVSAIPPSSRRLMALPARRARMLGSDGAIAMQERPALALSLLSELLGATLAAWLTSTIRRRRTIPQRLRHRRGQLKGALDLPALTVKLLSNPIVRGYLRRTVLHVVSRRLGR